MTTTNEPAPGKKGHWVFRPWKTVNGVRIYPKPPSRVFRWWEEDESDHGQA